MSLCRLRFCLSHMSLKEGQSGTRWPRGPQGPRPECGLEGCAVVVLFAVPAGQMAETPGYNATRRDRSYRNIESVRETMIRLAWNIAMQRAVLTS